MQEPIQSPSGLICPVIPTVSAPFNSSKTFILSPLNPVQVPQHDVHCHTVLLRQSVLTY